MALLARKTVKYVSAGALLKKQYVFKCVGHCTESFLTARNDVLSEKFTVLFLSFLQPLETNTEPLRGKTCAGARLVLGLLMNYKSYLIKIFINFSVL